MVVSVHCRSKSVMIESCQNELCISGLPLVRSKGIVGYGLFQQQAVPPAEVDTVRKSYTVL